MYYSNFDTSTSNNAWQDYLSALSPQLLAKRHPEFYRNQFSGGVLPLELATRAREAVIQSPHRPHVLSDHSKGSQSSHLDPATLALVNQRSRFVWPTGPLLWAASEIIEQLREPVAKALGCPWRVLNLKAWVTEPNVAAAGMYAWHTDGMPPDMFKVMLYLVEIGGENGGLQFQLADGQIFSVAGPPGTWILFYNSKLRHRAMAPTQDGLQRVVIEITLSPWLAFDLEPRFLGQNGRHAFWPFMKDNDRL